MPDERQEDPATLLMIGDVVGPPGLRALFQQLPSLKKKSGADLVVANGENALKGFGIGQEEMTSMLNSGVDVVTSGNHVWERKEASEFLDAEEKLLRPANYPPGLPGRGFLHFKGRRFEWIIINLQGREELYDIDCPFRTAAELVARAKRGHPSAFIVIDFHAESTEEKEALAWSLDGAVSVVAGTHTHVQTADERLLPKGTGYLTDLGMTGPIDSVIGVKKEICIKRSLSQIPYKMETAEGEAALSGALFSLDAQSRRCLSIERIYLAAAR
ncbi:MAG: TIGR00282 family metallophosphoesterase [Spirochaetes bacterium]|nr:TIGR00282 family metallophosphoesterase [Spirochaetota bacterium]